MKTEAELNKLTKVKLEECARTQGVELDRRKTKSGMIAEFFEKLETSNDSTVEEKPAIVIKSPDEVAEEEKVAAVKAEGDQQFNEFKKFIDSVKLSENVQYPVATCLDSLIRRSSQFSRLKCETVVSLFRFLMSNIIFFHNKKDFII